MIWYDYLGYIHYISYILHIRFQTHWFTKMQQFVGKLWVVWWVCAEAWRFYTLSYLSRNRNTLFFLQKNPPHSHSHYTLYMYAIAVSHFRRVWFETPAFQHAYNLYLSRLIYNAYRLDWKSLHVFPNVHMHVYGWLGYDQCWLDVSNMQCWLLRDMSRLLIWKVCD